MRSNTKSSITLPPEELRIVLALQAKLKAKSKVEVVRRGLRLLRDVTEREALREAYRKASRATRASLSRERGHFRVVRPRRGVLYLADLNPRRGAEPGTVRPVLIIQTDLLNETGHPSTWVLPCTTRLTGENLLRVVLPRGIAGNREECEVMVDQSRAIDNRRLTRSLKPLPRSLLAEVVEKLRRVGEL